MFNRGKVFFVNSINDITELLLEVVSGENCILQVILFVSQMNVIPAYHIMVQNSIKFNTIYTVGCISQYREMQAVKITCQKKQKDLKCRVMI